MVQIKQIVTNPYLITGLFSWIVAQIVKGVLFAIQNKKFDVKRLLGDGGMPSSHAATVMSLAAISGIMHGFASFQFGVSALLALIVCHDAMAVRREVEKQGAYIEEISKSVGSIQNSITLKKHLGHTPLQVLIGGAIGVCVALIVHRIMF